MIHRELRDFFGFMVLVVITAITIFIVILPQALPHLLPEAPPWLFSSM